MPRKYHQLTIEQLNLLRYWIEDEKKASLEYSSYIHYDPMFKVMATQEMQHHKFLVTLFNVNTPPENHLEYEVTSIRARDLVSLSYDRLDMLVEDERKASRDYKKWIRVAPRFAILSAEENSHRMFLLEFGRRIEL